MPSDIVIDRHAATVILRINRPEVRNACRSQTLTELNAAIAAAAADPSVRALILTGAGDKAFCAGADLREMAAASTSDDVRRLMTGWWDLIAALRGLRKPVIAAIRGYAVGGGTEIALACPITLASETARFGLAEIRHGHLPGAGGTALLPRQIGYGRGAYYLLTGDEILAGEAERLGLVAKVVTDAALEAEAEALAARIAALSPAAVAAMLTTIVEGRGLPVTARSNWSARSAQAARHARLRRGLARLRREAAAALWRRAMSVDAQPQKYRAVAPGAVRVEARNGATR